MDRATMPTVPTVSGNAYSHPSAGPLTILAGIITLIGGLNWGLVGLANTDLVASLFGAGSAFSRLVYIVVALASIWTFAASLRSRSYTPRAAG